MFTYPHVFLWHDNEQYSISSSKVPFINAQEIAPLSCPCGSGLSRLIHHPHIDNKYSCNININKKDWRHLFYPIPSIAILLFMRLMSDLPFAQWYNFRTDKYFFSFSVEVHVGKRIIITSIYFRIYKTNYGKKHLFALSFASNSFWLLLRSWEFCGYEFTKLSSILILRLSDLQKTVKNAYCERLRGCFY